MYVRGKYKIKCQTCGKVEEVYYSGRNKKFCSRACKRMDQEVKDRISKTKTGTKIHSEEWKQLKSKAMTGNKHRLGHKLSQEHIQAIVDAHSGEKSHFWKDGRCRDITYIRWQKGANSRRKRNADGKHTFKEWQDMKKEYNFTCPMCYRSEPEIKLTQDHVIPLSKGGTNDIGNIQPLCLHCNIVKYTKLIPRFQLVIIN